MKQPDQIVVIGFPPVNISRSKLEARQQELRSARINGGLTKAQAWEFKRIQSVLRHVNDAEQVYVLPFQLPPLPVAELIAPWALLAAIGLLIMTAEIRGDLLLWAARVVLIFVAGWGAYSLPDSDKTDDVSK